MDDRQKTLLALLPNGDEVSAKQRDPKYFRDFHCDPVWSREFWEERLFQCPSRRNRVSGPLDVDAFLAWPPHALTFIDDKTINRGIADGMFVCPECGDRHHLFAAAPRYLWHVQRVEPEQSISLEPIPTYIVA
jgi:hypothetical protein